MNNLKFVLLLLSAAVNCFSNNKINYQEPSPDANYVSIDNNIIIGFEKPVMLYEDDILKSIVVTGSESMRHSGKIIICSDGKKIIFKPDIPFNQGEKVKVNLTGKLLRTFSSSRNDYEYSFNTSSRKVQWDPSRSMKDELNTSQSFAENDGLLDVPQLTVTVNNNPSDGYLFLAPYTSASFLIITNKYGSVYWYSQFSALCGDFKRQPNGNLTYYDGNQHKHYELDVNYNKTDSFYCGNGYTADIHELRVLSNRHALLIAYDAQTIDMSQIVQGGNPNAIVVGLIIQEIDEHKNVVFQWRSWDHFAITDALHENLLAAYIDYVHGNAIEIDNDSNLLISSRHLDEITKINRTTGNIIWRFGGLNNQFTFLTDTLKFTYQHAVRRISNGNITLYDNGNFHSPPYSRAVEYTLDEINKTATLVWQYRHVPNVFGSWAGYVQRLDGGNTLIAWGGTRPTVTEVKPNGIVVFEASYPPGVFTYRAYKFDWNGPAVSTGNGTGKIPKDFRLNQNYPNPFNPFTTITYDIPKASYAELSVFDITGRELKKIVSGYLQAGSYKAVFDGSQYSSGLYIYRLKAGDFSASQKMVLVK